MNPSHQHQREKDSEVIAVEDLLVGKKGNWLTMDDGHLKLKWQAAGLVDDPLLVDDKTTITSIKSYAEWTNPNDPCLVTSGENVLFSMSDRSNSEAY